MYLSSTEISGDGLILNVGENQAEEVFVWWHKTFGDDFYVELIRHGIDEENHVNRPTRPKCQQVFCSIEQL